MYRNTKFVKELIFFLANMTLKIKKNKNASDFMIEEKISKF